MAGWRQRPGPARRCPPATAAGTHRTGRSPRLHLCHDAPPDGIPACRPCAGADARIVPLHCEFHGTKRPVSMARTAWTVGPLGPVWGAASTARKVSFAAWRASIRATHPCEMNRIGHSSSRSRGRLRARPTGWRPGRDGCSAAQQAGAGRVQQGAAGRGARDVDLEPGLRAVGLRRGASRPRRHLGSRTNRRRSASHRRPPPAARHSGSHSTSASFSSACTHYPTIAHNLSRMTRYDRGWVMLGIDW